MTSREIYQGRVIRLSEEDVSLPNGKQMTFELVKHPGASAVVPIQKDGTVVLVHQYRFAAGGFLYEVPAGKLSPGEAPEVCAVREVEEETGYRIGKLEKLTAILMTPGFCDEQIHLYMASDLSPSKQSLDHDEILRVVEFPFDQVLQMIRDQTIRDAKSIVALYLAYERFRGGR